jgi:hypothetical protein
MAYTRSLIFLALVALMVGTASAYGGGGGGRGISHKSFSLSKCAKTFPGCKECGGVFGEDSYTCDSCRSSSAVFDAAYKACICNSSEGYGVLPWAAAGKRCSSASCVKCADYQDATGATLEAGGGFCSAASE